MSYEQFFKDFFLRWQNAAVGGDRTTCILQTEKGHSFAVDMYKDVDGKLHLLILDSTVQVTSISQTERQFWKMLPGEERKDAQHAIHSLIVEEGSANIFYTAALSGDDVVIQKTQHSMQGCQFFAFFYAQLLQQIKGRNLHDFYTQQLPSMSHSLRLKNPDCASVGPVHPISWDTIGLAFHVVTQSCTRLTALLAKHPKESNTKAYQDIIDALNNAPLVNNKKANYAIFHYAHQLLLAAKTDFLRMQGDISSNDLFLEQQIRSILPESIAASISKYSQPSLSAVRQLRNWPQFTSFLDTLCKTMHGKDYALNLLLNMNSIPRLSEIRDVERNIHVFNLPFLGELRVAEESAGGDFLDGKLPIWQITHPFLVQMISPSLSQKKENPVNKALLNGDLSMAWMLRPENRDKIRKDDSAGKIKIDKRKLEQVMNDLKLGEGEKASSLPVLKISEEPALGSVLSSKIGQGGSSQCKIGHEVDCSSRLGQEERTSGPDLSYALCSIFRQSRDSQQQDRSCAEKDKDLRGSREVTCEA